MNYRAPRPTWSAWRSRPARAARRVLDELHLLQDLFTRYGGAERDAFRLAGVAELRPDHEGPRWRPTSRQIEGPGLPAEMLDLDA